METKIKFNFTGHVEQEVRIIQEDLTPQELVDGLNNGNYYTTIDSPNPDTGVKTTTVIYFDEDGSPVDVAEIVSTTDIEEDSSYLNFKVVDET